MNVKATFAGKLLGEEGAAAHALGMGFVVNGVGTVRFAGDLNVLNLDARGQLASCLGLANHILVGSLILTGAQEARDVEGHGRGRKKGREAGEDSRLSHVVRVGGALQLRCRIPKRQKVCLMVGSMISTSLIWVLGMKMREVLVV